MISWPEADRTAVPRLQVQASAQAATEFPLQHYRVYFVEAGEGAASLDNWNLKLRTGDVVTASPTELFTCDPAIKYCAVSFHHDFFCVRVKRSEVYCDGVVFNRTAGKPRIALPESEWPLLRLHMDELHRLLQSAGVFMEDRSVSALRSILLQIAEYKLQQIAVIDEIASEPLSSVVIEFQNLLELHYYTQREVGFYSDELNVTPATLNRRLKAELGQTVLQAINERVAIQARLELRSGKKSVKQVALELGFDDPLYFSRFFKKQFGHSPTHYFGES